MYIHSMGIACIFKAIATELEGGHQTADCSSFSMGHDNIVYYTSKLATPTSHSSHHDLIDLFGLSSVA